MTTTNRIVFMGALYQAGVRCSYLPGFLDKCGPMLDENFAGRRVLADAVERRIGELETSAETTALQRLCARDLQGIAQVVRDEGVVIPEDAKAIEASLEAVAQDAAKILARWGITLDHSPPLVVDELPDPYKRGGASALTIDEADQAAYGVESGVYMLRGSLRPFYSANLYLHELIHTILGKDDPERVAHGLEEGLADLVGAIWLSAQILGSNVTREIFVLNRLSSYYTPTWERYLDTARRLCVLYMYGGQRQLIELVKAGRAGVYEGERRLGIDLPTPLSPPIEEESEIITLAIDLLMAYPRSFVVSPEAYLFAEQSRSGLAISEVATAAGLSSAVGQEAAAELRDDIGALFLRKDNIVILEGEAAHLLSRSWLRYQSDPERDD